MSIWGESWGVSSLSSLLDANIGRILVDRLLPILSPLDILLCWSTRCEGSWCLTTNDEDNPQTNWNTINLKAMAARCLCTRFPYSIIWWIVVDGMVIVWHPSCWGQPFVACEFWCEVYGRNWWEASKELKSSHHRTKRTDLASFALMPALRDNFLDENCNASNVYVLPIKSGTADPTRHIYGELLRHEWVWMKASQIQPSTMLIDIRSIIFSPDRSIGSIILESYILILSNELY